MKLPFRTIHSNREYYLSQISILTDDLRQNHDLLHELKAEPTTAPSLIERQEEILVGIQRVILYCQNKVEK